MSKLNSSAREDPIAAKLVPTEILYYYDEPLIFTAEARFGPVICSKTDERNGSSEYLVAPTTKSTIEQLRSGSVSLRTAFSQPWCWLVETDHDFNLLTSAAKTLDTLPSDYLPEAEVGLYSYHGSVPEKVTPRIQHPAYISVRFSGRDLVAETMSFGVFKSLVDEIYVALRKVFLPAFESLISEGMSETRAGRLLRIPIRQPKFASLTVEIEEPKVDTSRLRDRIPKDLRHTEEAIEKAGTSFLEQMQTIEKMARERPLTTDVATSYFSTLDALSHIAPSADTSVERVEIAGTTPQKATSRIVIDASLGDRIRDAHRLAARSERDFRGTIIEFNEKSGTFVLIQANGRQVTCELSPKDLEESKSAFFKGRRVTVRGALQRRVRRDYLKVKHVGFSTE